MWIIRTIHNLTENFSSLKQKDFLNQQVGLKAERNEYCSMLALQDCHDFSRDTILFINGGAFSIRHQKDHGPLPALRQSLDLFQKNSRITTAVNAGRVDDFGFRHGWRAEAQG